MTTPFPMTRDECAAARERCDASHNEKWILGGCSGRMITTPSGYVGDGFLADFDTLANATFAAHAHQDLPRALDTIEALRERVRELAAQNEQLTTRLHKTESDYRNVYDQEATKQGRDASRFKLALLALYDGIWDETENLRQVIQWDRLMKSARAELEV